MLNIFASTFMTATRLGDVRVRDVPPKSDKPRRRRWNAPTRWVDLSKL